MKKYKIKKKRTCSISTILFIILIVSTLIGLGYSLYRSTLNIYGTVYLDSRQLSDTLENIMQPLSPGTTEYITITTAETGFVIESQELVENTLTINAAKQDSKGKGRNLDLNFKLKNVGINDYLNGTYDVQITGGKGFISSDPTVTQSKTILSKQTEPLSIQFSGLKNNKLTSCTCTITIQYEINSVIEKFNIIVNFN